MHGVFSPLFVVAVFGHKQDRSSIVNGRYWFTWVLDGLTQLLYPLVIYFSNRSRPVGSFLLRAAAARDRVCCDGGLQLYSSFSDGHADCAH